MRKIAIIEDDSALAEMYKLKFEAGGFEAVVAADGAQGFELCEKIRPDLVLLDLMMPEMTGDEMLSKMRNTDWGKKIKVVVITNVDENEAPKQLRDLNIDKYVVKAEHTPSQLVVIAKGILDGGGRTK